MKDELFGELSYDFIWEGRIKIKLYNQEFDVDLNINGEEEKEITQTQRDAFIQYFKNEKEISLQIENAIFKYYKSIYDVKRECNYTNIDEKVPDIDNSSDMIKLIKPIYFCIPETDNEREVDILFNCTWDFDWGMGVKIVNEHVICVGVQNDVL